MSLWITMSMFYLLHLHKLLVQDMMRLADHFKTLNKICIVSHNSDAPAQVFVCVCVVCGVWCVGVGVCVWCVWCVRACGVWMCGVCGVGVCMCVCGVCGVWVYGVWCLCDVWVCVVCVWCVCGVCVVCVCVCVSLK
jgi:hypothetical protein